MRSLHRQKGISFWALLILVPMIGFYIFLGIKIGPEYMNFMSVKGAVDSVANEVGIKKPSRQEMRESIDTRLDVSSIYFMKKEYIVFKEMKDGMHILTTYDREIPLGGNVYVTLKFEHDAVVKNSN